MSRRVVIGGSTATVEATLNRLFRLQIGSFMRITNSHRRVSEGFVVECRGADVRARTRSVATVISVTGTLNQNNIEHVSKNICRFTALDGPLIVDVGNLEIHSMTAFARLLSTFRAECRRRSVDWVLVAPQRYWEPSAGEDQPVSAASVQEALQHFIAVIHTRRGALAAWMGDGRSEANEIGAPLRLVAATDTETPHRNGDHMTDRHEDTARQHHYDAQLHEEIANGHKRAAEAAGGSSLHIDASEAHRLAARHSWAQEQVARIGADNNH